MHLLFTHFDIISC